MSNFVEKTSQWGQALLNSSRVRKLSGKDSGINRRDKNEDNYVRHTLMLLCHGRYVSTLKLILFKRSFFIILVRMAVSIIFLVLLPILSAIFDTNTIKSFLYHTCI